MDIYIIHAHHSEGKCIIRRSFFCNLNINDTRFSTISISISLSMIQVFLQYFSSPGDLARPAARHPRGAGGGDTRGAAARGGLPEPGAVLCCTVLYCRWVTRAWWATATRAGAGTSADSRSSTTTPASPGSSTTRASSPTRASGNDKNLQP